MVTKGERGGINKEYRINRYTLAYIKQINKDLQYSTGKYIQDLVITYNGKESEKKYIYIKHTKYNQITLLKSTIVQ